MVISVISENHFELLCKAPMNFGKNETWPGLLFIKANMIIYINLFFMYLFNLTSFFAYYTNPPIYIFKSLFNAFLERKVSA